MALESDTGLPPTCHFPSPTPPTRAVQEQIQLLTHVTQRNPADLDACLELGKVMARSGHYPGTPHPAAPYFLHVLAREPSYPTAAYELGMLSFHRDEVDNAERLFRREISCNPGHDYAHIYLGRILECHRHDFEGALACYRTGAALDPNEAVGHFYLGDLLCHYFSNADDAAIQAYRRAIAINPGFSNAYQNLGIVLAGLALKGKPEPKVSFDANRSLRMECPFSEEDILEYHRNRDEAIEAFRAAIVHKPDYADAYWRLGVLLAATDDEVGAEAAICKCVELNPQQPNGEVALADLRHRIANPKTEEERTAELLQKAFAGLGTGTGAAAAGRGSGNDREDDEEADSKATAGGTKQKGSKKKKKKKKKK
jgi:tetratricopeptide (TPR) repeat protein